MNVRDMTDAEVAAHALNLWANHIETGKVTLSADDAKRMGQSILLRPLDDNQRSLVKRLRVLSSETLRQGQQSVTSMT